MSQLEPFVIVPVEVEFVLKNLCGAKVSCPDGIRSRVLFEIASEIGSPLCNLLNVSPTQGKVPDSWKEAHVYAVSKKEIRHYHLLIIQLRY